VEGLLAADEDSSAADEQLCSLYVSSLSCSKSRVRARMKSGLLHSTSPSRFRWPSLFRSRASRSHASERNCCLGLSSVNTHCHSRMQAIRHANDTAASHSVLHLPHVVDVGYRGISGEACRYVTQRRRPACMFRSHAREIETGIRPCGRLLPLWLDWYRRLWPCLASLSVLISFF
jgi:hypothetical protein